MPVPFNFTTAIATALTEAAAQLELDSTIFTTAVRIADPRHGDFQANGVLPYAKRTKQNPRALAEQVVAALPSNITDSCDVQIAGPGFLNFTLKPDALEAWLTEFTDEAALQAGAESAQPEADKAPSNFTASEFVSDIIFFAFLRASLKFRYVLCGISTTIKLFLIPILTLLECSIIVFKLTSLVDL